MRAWHPGLDHKQVRHVTLGHQFAYKSVPVRAREYVVIDTRYYTLGKGGGHQTTRAAMWDRYLEVEQDNAELLIFQGPRALVRTNEYDVVSVLATADVSPQTPSHPTYVASQKLTMQMPTTPYYLAPADISLFTPLYTLTPHVCR